MAHLSPPSPSQSQSQSHPQRRKCKRRRRTNPSSSQSSTLLFGLILISAFGKLIEAVPSNESSDTSLQRVSEGVVPESTLATVPAPPGATLETGTSNSIESKSSSISSGKIVGGTPAVPGSYPFLVALFNTVDPSNVLPVCGGSLITPSVVLTAAHCIFSIRSAMIGRYDFNAPEQGVEVYRKIQRRVHPDYIFSTFDYDYALVKLERPHPDPVLVSLRRTPELPIEMQIVGWGVTQENGLQPTSLMEAVVTRFDDQACKSNYDPDIITETMFCANEVGIDSCQGDSGGPVIIPDTNVQVGIVSWGNGCADPTFPGVYARIDTGIEWIERAVCTDLSREDCVDGKLPIVSSDGKIQEKSCEDRDGKFLGLGKKLKMRDCAWVGAYKKRRCQWYAEDYCPATCAVTRCP